MRNLLFALLQECETCDDVFKDNVALIAGDNGELTDEQIEAVLIHLADLHRAH
jgi:hypothetical protein